jgi:Flp pilus assembly protein TadB
VAGTPQRRQQVHAVITEAQESLPDQLHRRQVRYITMMSLRVVCLVAAVIVVSLHPPYAMVWVTVCIVGMVLLPWMAVLIANDRPPRKESEFRSRLHRRPAEALPASEPEPAEPHVIEHPVDP